MAVVTASDTERNSSRRRKRIYWPIIFPLGIVLLGIYHVPFAWREMRADVVAMPTKPLFSDVRSLPKLSIAQWETAVRQLTRSLAIQPRHPDHLTMLGRLYLVRATGADVSAESRTKYLNNALVYLRAALKDRPFHLESHALIKEAQDMLALDARSAAKLPDSRPSQPIKPQSK
jgi:hypothetical protein